MDALSYKPQLQEVCQRLTALHERRAMDQIFATMGVPNAELTVFAARYRDAPCDYPDPAERIAFWDRLLAQRAAIDDDSIPSAYLSEMDQGLYGGMLGGEVQLVANPQTGWISSMVPPLLKSYADLPSLRLDCSHPWFQRYLRQLQAFVAGSAGKFGISHFILINGLNFLFELVGATQTYLSLDERPEWALQAIDLGYEVNLAVHQAFFAHVPLLAGGTCSNYAQWFPNGRIISESVDPFHMTSAAYFDQWGRQPTERIFSHFDGGVIHIHANGRHLLEVVGTVRGLRALFLGDDRGYPPALDVLPQLRQRTGNIPLVVQAEYPRFLESLQAGRLCGGILYKVDGVPDVAAANRAMEEVRHYRV